MAELVWPGKGAARARRAARILTDEVHGAAPRGGWTNRLIRGDVLDVSGALADDLAGKVALVYVDPPFETGGRFDYRATVHGLPDDAPRVALPAYDDARGLDAWLGWFHEVAARLRDLLRPDGSLYVHLDAHTAHYAKCVLDEVFGAACFQREVVWRIGWVSGFKSRAKNWIRNHDTLLFYTRSPRRFTFHKEYVPYPPGYVRRDGAPPTGKGYPIEDVWNASALDRMDSIQIMSFSGEKVGYPTQKNESLVARIVRASSSPSDVVLDAFVGSGTTAVVAEKLGRRWVCADASPLAVHATRKRLLALPEPAPFVVESAGVDARDSSRLTARVKVAARTATIDLAGFALPRRAARDTAAAGVEHWSQWIDGWCVDWDNRGGPMRATSRSWRGRAARASLVLSAAHTYSRAGEYRAVVRAYDVLGGVATRELRVRVRP
jgi:DNA modification methylase